MIDLTPKQIEAIVPILTDWALKEIIDEFQCEAKLLDSGLSQDEMNFCMDAVNTVEIDKKGVETVLINAIELANHNEDDDLDWEDDPYSDYVKKEMKCLHFS
jgi:hypothetical protein